MTDLVNDARWTCAFFLCVGLIVLDVAHVPLKFKVLVVKMIVREQVEVVEAQRMASPRVKLEEIAVRNKKSLERRAMRSKI